MKTELFLRILFWTSTGFIIYTYVGYGLLIYLISKFKNILAGKKGPPAYPAEYPAVTIIIAAYNEARFIEQKINNAFNLDYPKDKLKIFIVTDGSDDDTPEIVRQYSAIQLFHLPERRGKNDAVNRIMGYVDTPITIFSDSNTFLNEMAVKNIVRHYEDPKVGGVAGEKRIVKKNYDSASSAGEGFYWKYESFLKKKDSELHSIVGAAGELFSVRTSLFEPAPHNMIIEDFYVSMKVVSKGYRFAYEPEAYAIESGSATVNDEWKRKVRISAGGLQAIEKFASLLNVVKYGMVSFQYISHRVLRWTIAPLSLFIALVSNLFLAIQGLPFYILLFVLQLFFYCFAFAGYLFRGKKIFLKGFFVPLYFVMMNLSVYAGLVRFLRKSQSVVWEKSERA